MSFLIPKSPSLPLIPPSPSRSGRVLDEARRTQGPATRLRSGRAPTILTDPRLARREPASDAGRPVTTAGALQDEARRGMGDVAFLHRRQQIRPEAQREIDEAKRKPGKVLMFRMEESRRWAILNDWPTRFNIEDNPKELGDAPLYRDHEIGVEAVKKHDEIIEREALMQGVDPRLVRAIMYVENADGNFLDLNRQLEKVGLAESILPMNIKPRLWADLIGVKEEEFRKPEVNIRTAVTLIRRIQERLDDPTPARVGSIYNFTGREKVSDVGARIQKAFDEKLWRK